VEPLIKRIDKQRVAVRGDHRRAYRMAWWDEMRHSAEMERYWTRWTTRAGREPWRDLYEVDRYLRQLPSRTYDYVGDLDTFCTRLYSLDIPRGVLWHIYSLFLLRERLCRELGIAIQPLAPDAYDIEDMGEATRQDDVTKRDATEQVVSLDDVIKAAEACQAYFWAQSSWAVVYCVYRDHLEMEMSMSEFERRVADYPLSPKTKPCPEGTIRKAFSNNPDMNLPIRRWSEDRAKILAKHIIAKLG